MRCDGCLAGEPLFGSTGCLDGEDAPFEGAGSFAGEPALGIVGCFDGEPVPLGTTVIELFFAPYSTILSILSYLILLFTLVKGKGRVGFDSLGLILRLAVFVKFRGGTTCVAGLFMALPIILLELFWVALYCAGPVFPRKCLIKLICASCPSTS